MPASDRIRISMSIAYPGCRFIRPFKSSMSSAAWPSRRSAATRANTPKFINM